MAINHSDKQVLKNNISCPGCKLCFENRYQMKKKHVKETHEGRDILQEKELSDRNDMKILEKQRKSEEEEAKEQEVFKRKRVLSPKMEVKKNKICVKSSKLPNGFEEIQQNLKEHFPANHVVQLIKPDGLCGVSAGG